MESRNVRNSLFIGNLSILATKAALEDTASFEGFVPLRTEIKEKWDKKQNLVRYAFVEYSTYEQTEIALNNLSGKYFLGRHLRVNWGDGGKQPKENQHQVAFSFRSSQEISLVFEGTIYEIFLSIGLPVVDVAINRHFPVDQNSHGGNGFVDFNYTDEGVEAVRKAVAVLGNVVIEGHLSLKCEMSRRLALSLGEDGYVTSSRSLRSASVDSISSAMSSATLSPYSRTPPESYVLPDGTQLTYLQKFSCPHTEGGFKYVESFLWTGAQHAVPPPPLPLYHQSVYNNTVYNTPPRDLNGGGYTRQQRGYSYPTSYPVPYYYPQQPQQMNYYAPMSPFGGYPQVQMQTQYPSMYMSNAVAVVSPSHQYASQQQYQHGESHTPAMHMDTHLEMDNSQYYEHVSEGVTQDGQVDQEECFVGHSVLMSTAAESDNQPPAQPFNAVYAQQQGHAAAVPLYREDYRMTSPLGYGPYGVPYNGGMMFSQQASPYMTVPVAEHHNMRYKPVNVAAVTPVHTTTQTTPDTVTSSSASDEMRRDVPRTDSMASVDSSASADSISSEIEASVSASQSTSTTMPSLSPIIKVLTSTPPPLTYIGGELPKLISRDDILPITLGSVVE